MGFGARGFGFKGLGLGLTEGLGFRVWDFGLPGAEVLGGSCPIHFSLGLKLQIWQRP